MRYLAFKTRSGVILPRYGALSEVISAHITQMLGHHPPKLQGHALHGVSHWFSCVVVQAALPNQQ